MIRFLAVLAFLGLLASGSAPAQVEVSAQTERTNFLLYERVDLLVTIQNISGSDLVLSGDENRPWLSFLVSKHNRLPVAPERKATYDPLPLKAGETKTLKVNLTPLFAFRETGDYQTNAVVDLPGQGGQIISPPVPFVVMDGRTVWTQQRPVDNAQYTYSLIRFSPGIDETDLYLRVENPAENLVYANLSLGKVTAYVDPDVFFDPAGNLHILHPTATGTYLYTRLDPRGRIVGQRIFKTYREIRPQLAKLEDGSVVVNGGLELDPNAPRPRLSETQGPQPAPKPPVTSQQ